ncbi:MAG: DUF5357 family protein [Cyanobacteria bacterium SBLK]|nr:DUF5357 family protein [Cyanobacteria bacterium SBLK]
MKDIFDKIWGIFKPPRAYCWQTLFCLSLFSALMSAIARGFIGEIIAIFGYLLLIVSFAWLGIESRWQSTPWLVSALICLLLWGLLKIQPQILILLWFPLSAIVASLASFITRNLEFKFPNPHEGQEIVILLEIQILLACWVQFYFLCNDWLQQYPSLLSENFNESQLIVHFDLAPLSQPRGWLILEGMQRLLEQQVNDRPWIEAIKWLQDSDREGFLSAFQRQILAERDALSESSLWVLESQFSSTPSGYQFKLIAQWKGPRSNTVNDITELICDIHKEEDVARIICNIVQNNGFTSQK